jgi:hypothetical protein
MRLSMRRRWDRRAKLRESFLRSSESLGRSDLADASFVTRSFAIPLWLAAPLHPGHIDALQDIFNTVRQGVCKQQPEAFFTLATIDMDGTIEETT